MKVKVLCFGITRDLLGGFENEIDIAEGSTVGAFQKILFEKFPDLQKLNSLRIAVNEEYGSDDLELKPTDEIVLIPPVSGG